MSDIKKAETLLNNLRNDLHTGCTRTEAIYYIDAILPLLPRKRAIRKTPPSSIPMTNAIGQKVRAMFKAEPNMPLQTIATRFGINLARVSEAVNEKKWTK